MHLQLGNNRSALKDSQAAVSRNSTSTKARVEELLSCHHQARACVILLSACNPASMLPQAYFRGARAAVRLRHWDVAQQLCTAALRATPDAQELAALLKVQRLQNPLP